MAGAVDLFAGRQPIAGINLFKTDKDPLNQLDMGIEDVIGQQGLGAGSQVNAFIQSLAQAILGLGGPLLTDAEGVWTASWDYLNQFFGDIESFFNLGQGVLGTGGFDLTTVIEGFIHGNLKPTNLLAMLVNDPFSSGGVTGFIPMENLALEAIGAVVGTAQSVIDAILASVGFPPGSGTATQVDSYFADLLAMLANPSLTSGTFDPSSAVGTLITDMMHPLNLLAPMNPVTSLISALNIPGLDATKIITGQFPQSQVKDLETELNNLWASIVSGTADLQSVWDAILASVGIGTGVGTATQTTQYFTDLMSMLANPDLTSGTFNPVTAITDFISGMLNPTNMLAPMNPSTSLLFPLNIPGLDATKITTGVFGTGLIPGLDVSKIISGVFGSGFIPSLDATKITTGTFTTGLIPNITKAMSTDLQGTIDAVFQALNGGSTTGNTVSSVKTGLLNIPGVNIVSAVLSSIIPSLDATKITTGIFTTGLIPGLDVSKIITGVFSSGFIPVLDATKITTGTFSTGLIPNVTKAMSTDLQATIDNIFQSMNGGSTTGNTVASVKTSLLSIPGANIISAVLASIVPGLDATKITTGSFAAGRIPGLDVSKIITGVFGTTFIPSLDATKIVSGTFTTGLIPNITKAMSTDMQSIVDNVFQAMNGGSTTGNTLASVKTSLLNIPGLNIVTSLLATVIPSLDATKITTGQFPQSMVNITSIAAGIVSGILATGNIPALDATKITTGTFTTGLIPNITKAMSTDMQSIVDNIFQASSGGSSTGNTLASVKTSLLNIPGVNIISAIASSIVPVLDASKITTGIFGTGLIPSLDATKITTGIFGTGLIPALDATKITTGTFADAFVPGLSNRLLTSLWQAREGSGSNLVISPQFDDNTVTREIQSAGAANGTVAYSTVKARSGTQSLLLTGSTSTSGQSDLVFLSANTLGGGATRTVASAQKVQPAQKFYAEIYVMGKTVSATTGTVNLRFILRDSTGVNAETTVDAGTVNVNGLSTTVWTKISGYVTVTAGYDLAWPVAGIIGGNVASQAVYLEDALVREETAAQNLTTSLYGGTSIVGSILAAVVPTLDASKVTTGVFGTGLIPSLPASQITTGTFGAGLIPALDASKITTGAFTTARIPDVTKAMSTDLQATIDAVYQAINGGVTTGNTTASVKTALLNIPGPNIVTSLLATVIPSLDATKITTGAFATARIPSLPAGQITSGIFTTGLIPGLDATKIITGTFTTGLIPNVTASMSTDIQALVDGAYQAVHGGATTGNLVSTFKTSLLNIPGPNIISAITTSVVPSLDATKVTTGIFGTGLIPALDASKVTTGVFGATQIPGLDASKITSGTFANSSVPGLGTLQSVVTSQAGAGGNLIIDPGFDNATIWANEPGVMDTAQKVNGTQSRRTTANGTVLSLNLTACGSGGAAPIWAVQPGWQYYLEASIFPKATNVGGGQIAVVASVWDSTGVNPFTYVLSPYFAAPPASGQWTKLGGYLTIPAGYDGMIPYCTINNNVPVGDQFYWDRLVCKPVVTNLPATNVLGTGGPASSDATHQSIWDNLWQGFTGSATGTGKSIADVNNAATTLYNQVAAVAAYQMGIGAPIPVSTTYTGGSYTYTIPSWANFIDVIEIGAGGGGQGLGLFGSWGEGGHGGVWNSVTINYGTTFPRTTTTITGTVGAGGTAGPGSGTTNGGTGGSTTAAATGWSGGLTAAGGAGGTLANLDTNGKSPGDTTFHGTTYTGGVTQTSTATLGNAPGGGGSGATYTYQAGGAGARGQIWFVARAT